MTNILYSNKGQLISKQNCRAITSPNLGQASLNAGARRDTVTSISSVTKLSELSGEI